MSISEKVLEKFIDKAIDYIIARCKIVFNGLSVVEVIKMDREKAVTNISFRENEFLIKRQGIFIIKALVLNVILSLLFYSKLADICGQFSGYINNKISIYFHIEYDLGLYLDLYYIGMSFLIFVLHIFVLVKLNETFIRHLYGYKIDIRDLRDNFKFSKGILNIVIMYTVIDYVYLYTQNILMFWGVLISVSLLIVIYIILKVYMHYRKDFICSFSVKGYSVKETNRADLINGKTDITINFIQNYKRKFEKVNIFENNLYIVENGNILLLGKGIRNIYEKEIIKSITINNQRDVNITLKYDSEFKKWRV